MKLRDGIYLVGRNDGGTEPFMCSLADGYVTHFVRQCVVEVAVKGANDHWWWRRMDIPERLPDDCLLNALPPIDVNRGGLL